MKHAGSYNNIVQHLAVIPLSVWRVVNVTRLPVEIECVSERCNEVVDGQHGLIELERDPHLLEKNVIDVALVVVHFVAILDAVSCCCYCTCYIWVKVNPAIDDREVAVDGVVVSESFVNDERHVDIRKNHDDDHKKKINENL